jgi:hypothetical protein
VNGQTPPGRYPPALKSQIIQSARLSFQSELGPPHPHPQGSVAPPPFGSKGRGRHTRLRGRGETHSLAGRGWEDPIPTDGQTPWYSLYYNPSKHKVLTYIEYRAVSGVFRTIDRPPPLHPGRV